MLSSTCYCHTGQRALKQEGSTVTRYIGGWSEVSVSAGVTTTTNYYWFGGRRAAMKVGGAVSYLYADQLGSTVKTSGAQAATQRYEPYGAKRGTDTVATIYRYTGQREESALGLYDYGARWYDPTIGRFIQADSIVPEPGNPQSLNRYSYVLNNPMRYTDPSGHALRDADDEIGEKGFKKVFKQVFGWNMVGTWNGQQLNVICIAEYLIEQYVDSILGDSSGRDWVIANASDITMYVGPLWSGANRPNMGPSSGLTLFSPTFETDKYGGYGAVGLALHELGHNISNKVAARRSPFNWAVVNGGGPADDLYRYLGGENLHFPRYNGGVDFGDDALDPRLFQYPYQYGNNSTADYFAQTFALSVLGIEAVPSDARDWLKFQINMGWWTYK